MRAYRLAPRRLRLVHPRAGAGAVRVLLEAARGAAGPLRVLPPLLLGFG
jgi:tRNA1(Val) A37 N6-methylase TrmN6